MYEHDEYGAYSIISIQQAFNLAFRKLPVNSRWVNEEKTLACPGHMGTKGRQLKDKHIPVK